MTRKILRLALITFALLLIPAVAMLLTREVNWGPGDFVTAGALLFGTGLAYELMARRTRTARQRLVLGVALGGALLLVWAQLAVGIV